MVNAPDWIFCKREVIKSFTVVDVVLLVGVLVAGEGLAVAVLVVLVLELAPEVFPVVEVFVVVVPVLVFELALLDVPDVVVVVPLVAVPEVGATHAFAVVLHTCGEVQVVAALLVVVPGVLLEVLPDVVVADVAPVVLSCAYAVLISTGLNCARNFPAFFTQLNAVSVTHAFAVALHTCGEVQVVVPVPEVVPVVLLEVLPDVVLPPVVLVLLVVELLVVAVPPVEVLLDEELEVVVLELVPPVDVEVVLPKLWF